MNAERAAALVSAALIALAVAFLAPSVDPPISVHADVHVLSDTQVFDLLRR